MSGSARNQRPWDVVLTPLIRARVQDRRLHPDGELVPTKTIKVAGVEKHSYPWNQMSDGDFFIVPLTKNIEAQKNGIRQGAARSNIEVSFESVTCRVNGSDVPGIRVTRVQGNIRLIRYAANLRDPSVSLGFDVKARAERTREWRNERKRALQGQPIRRQGEHDREGYPPIGLEQQAEGPDS